MARRVAMGKEPVPEPSTRATPPPPIPPEPVRRKPENDELPVDTEPPDEGSSLDQEDDLAIFGALNQVPQTFGESQRATGIDPQRLRIRLRRHQRAGFLRLGDQKRWSLTPLGRNYFQFLSRPTPVPSGEAEDEAVEEGGAASVLSDYRAFVEERERRRRQHTLLDTLRGNADLILRTQKKLWKYEDPEPQWLGATDDLLD